MSTLPNIFKFRVENMSEITEHECTISEILETVESMLLTEDLVGINYPESIDQEYNFSIFLDLISKFPSPAFQVEWNPSPNKGYEELCYIQKIKNNKISNDINKMSDTLQTIKNCQRKDYHITDIENLSNIYNISSGSESSFGTVFKACYSGKSCDYILKLIPLNSDKTAYPLTEDDIQKEVTMQKVFFDKGLAPKLVDAFSCDGKAYIIMEKMNIDFFQLIMMFVNSKCPIEFKVLIFQYLMSKAIKLIDIAHILGLTHGDPHLQNIMINPKLEMIKSLFNFVSNKKFIQNLEDAENILKNINTSKYKDLFMFVLATINDEDEITQDYIEENFDSLAEDLLLYFGDNLTILFNDFFQSPERLGKFLNINSSKFIDFGQSDYIKNNKGLVSTDWAKLGGGKYKGQLLEKFPESKQILDLFSLVGYH